MQNNNKEINPPFSFALCFNSQCPRRDICLRYQAGLHVTGNNKIGITVYPMALQPDGSCDYYRESSLKMHAYGFSRLFSQVKHKHVATLRDALKQHLGGHGTYYRYNRGEKLLTPIQKESVFNIFRQYGYTEMLAFDKYVSAYDFSD